MMCKKIVVAEFIDAISVLLLLPACRYIKSILLIAKKQNAREKEMKNSSNFAFKNKLKRNRMKMPFHNSSVRNETSLSKSLPSKYVPTYKDIRSINGSGTKPNFSLF